jgi:ribosomal protein S18 acetylase RimI-like enzyme
MVRTQLPETLMQTERRAARAQDLEAICALHVASWRRAYRGMVSDAFLGDPVVAGLGARWAVLPGADWIVDCIWQGEDLLGFISVDRAHQGGPYVDNLHVAHRVQGQGIGRVLMAGTAAQLLAEGYDTLWLTVIRENHPTRAFYRRIGGVEGPDYPERLFGEPIHALPVHWHDLSVLARF